MLMIKKLALILALVASPAFAQQQQPTALDRVSISLGQCVGSVEQRVDEIAVLRKQLAEAQARIKELEPKKQDQ
jgi:hypothetical protein